MVRDTFKGIRLLLLAPLLASCAAMEANTQGPLQPQSVAGPCQVQRFFLLGARSVPTQMTVTNTGQACTFTLINPALNVVVSAALLSGAPTHGRAEAGLISGARQAAVSYTPAPGYVGPDKFDITLEPGAVGVTVNVTVQAGR
jgi:hypothetical protein